MAKKFNVTGEQRDDIDGQMIEIKRQLRLKSGSPIDPKLVKLALQDIVEGKFIVKENKIVEEKPSTLSILRLISDGEALGLKELDGKRIIYNSKKTFLSFIDEDFKNWNLNKEGVATPETPVQVNEIVQDSTFMEIFSALAGMWNQKWVSQHQVIEFCENLFAWLSPTGATMFLVKKDENQPIDEANPQDNLVVVLVRVYSVGLIVSMNPLENGYRWFAEFLRRVVSPQLIPLSE